MKNQYSRMDNICPKEPKKLRIPDQLDLYMEDALSTMSAASLLGIC